MQELMRSLPGARLHLRIGGTCVTLLGSTCSSMKVPQASSLIQVIERLKRRFSCHGQLHFCVSLWGFVRPKIWYLSAAL